MTKTNQKLYRQLSEPHADAEAANNAIELFMAAVEAARMKQAAILAGVKRG